MNLHTAIARWVDYRQRLAELNLVAASTLGNQSAICLRLIDGLGAVGLADLRKSHVEFFIGERRKTCAPVTVRGEINVLRQILNWCVDEQMLLARPRLPTVGVSSTEVSLPADEAFLWVLANAPSGIARALEFMMLTGLSPHELERVQVRDGTTRFAAGVSHGDVIRIGMREDFPVKQPSRRRIIPLNDRAKELWATATSGLQAEAAPFPKVATMQKAVRRAVENTCAPGADRITPKLMRKWFASKVAGQQPEHVLQRLMGHAPGSPITRRHYVRSSDEQVQQATQEVSI